MKDASCNVNSQIEFYRILEGRKNICIFKAINLVVGHK